MEYQEASEEVGFKGTMTLAAVCVVWLLPFVALGTVLIPGVGWVQWPIVGWVYVPHPCLLMVPFSGRFPLLQLLRYLIPANNLPVV